MSDMHNQVYSYEDFEARKFLPPGRYQGIICGHVSGVTQKGTKTIRLLLRVEEPLSGQDLTGIETNVELKSQTFFETPDAKHRFFDQVRAINPEALKPGTFPEIAENTVLTKVTFDFIQQKSKTNDATWWECINIKAA